MTVCVGLDFGAAKIRVFRDITKYFSQFFEFRFFRTLSRHRQWPKKAEER